MKIFNLFIAIILIGFFRVAFDQKTETTSGINKKDDTVEMCAGQIPTGWIKINDKWDPNRCGKPSSVSYNVYTIERIDNRAIGTVISACVVSTIPAGWVKTGEGFDPSRCGHPSSYSNNVWNIKRIQ